MKNNKIYQCCIILCCDFRICHTVKRDTFQWQSTQWFDASILETTRTDWKWFYLLYLQSRLCVVSTLLLRKYTLNAKPKEAIA